MFLKKSGWMNYRVINNKATCIYASSYICTIIITRRKIIKKKIILVFLVIILTCLSFGFVKKVEAYELGQPGDSVDTSDICYGSGCMNTTPDSITEMNWTAQINDFDFSRSDYSNISEAYYNGDFINIPIGSVKGKDSCSVSNTELFLGEYIGPQNGTSSTYYNHGITGDFYINDYYYHSSWLNESHTVYNLYENCQEYKVINQEWSNDISLNSIIFKTSYTTGPSFHLTSYQVSYYYFEYSQIKDYLVEVIDYLEENTEYSINDLNNMYTTTLIALIGDLIGSKILGSSTGGLITILGIMKEIDKYEQVQSIDYVEDMINAMETNSNKILRLKYKWMLGPNQGVPSAYRSHEALNKMDVFTYPSVNISDSNENMSSINYYDYSFGSTQNLFEDFSETSLLVFEFIEE